jgi:hypothetical protein
LKFGFRIFKIWANRKILFINQAMGSGKKT